MSRSTKILGLILLLPYAYMVYYWTLCSDCGFTLEALWYSFFLVMAFPIFLAVFSFKGLVSSARAMRGEITAEQVVAVANGKPTKSANGRGKFFWLWLAIFVWATFACWQIYVAAFPDVEEGRDRLGRICESDGNSTRCRPDPANRKDPFEGLTVGDL